MNFLLGIIVGLAHGLLFNEPSSVLPMAVLATIVFYLYDIKELLGGKDETP